MEDCVRALNSKYLESGVDIDVHRVVIRGKSLEAYTALAAIANEADPEHKVFSAATSYYGISDIVSLAKNAHKFESHYFEKLLGAKYEEKPEVYEDRSPVNHADRIVAPLLLLQGKLDKVVSPEQAQKICDTVQKKGGVCEIMYFDGEGHGFTVPAYQKRALDSELAWYKEHLKLQ